MKVILTHEQADFDALASMLCAYLLNDEAIPVLPNRLNRNVRNFLNLYGGDFPFEEARDLAQGGISQVTLVDTQSLVTLKGINNKTAVNIVDHHDPRSDLPSNWQGRFEKVGATTTILVDLLREHGHPISMIQATLLLLGIYEDTGSLTYASTSVRDVNAAAYLLEKGASLKIAVNYLNPALSENQKKMADLLLENARTHNINGKTIIISCAKAVELNEEISSIAHKLRDLLDPDALFLFVRTAEGVRLVARSTSDQVDVAHIAQRFGGGGHSRAAAALIQVTGENGTETMEVYTRDVVTELERVIEPPLTINKIMSKKPHLISPLTSLDEANKLMQRYGYEGYPVVEDGRVVGLLTRRAVDRALNHKLNLNAGSLMEAGEHFLKNTDTIDKLQQLMAATGWGQIPVVDEETGRITGIVTRTDLLKTLPGHNGAVPGQKNYAATLEKALPPSRLALLKLMASTSGQAQHAIYIVGGFVRDLLLERPSLDFDIVVEGDALQFAQSLAQQYGGRVIPHKRFSTAKWQIKNFRSGLLKKMGVENGKPTDLPEELDFISARTEFYDHPTALPTVERSSIKLDLHRRDFTINTLALRLDGHHYGELYDYWGGLKDLERKQVRVLHSLSFVDDPTRLLRAVRFEQRFHFQIEKRTLQLMKEALDLLHQLSGERIHHEFDLIFNDPDPLSIMRRLEALGLLRRIHPGLEWQSQFEPVFSQAVTYAQFSDWNLPDTIGNTPTRLALIYLTWLANLDGNAGLEVAHRLRLPRQILDTLEKLIETCRKADQMALLPPSKLTLELEKIPLYGVFALFCLSDDSHYKERINLYATKWRFISSGIDGNTLRSRGIPPGPQYARVLSQIRDAWLDGQISTPSEESELLERLLGEQDD
ncbi:MAG TPA: CBS domain-containing protein [Anaerolineaceae bacterium]|nr:CBS domain-containing protein [Anaerolineaceae bacterium]